MNECTNCTAVCAERNNFYKECIGYREDEDALWNIADEMAAADPEHREAGYFYGATYEDLERFIQKKDKGRITFLNTVDDQETVKKLNPERPEE